MKKALLITGIIIVLILGILLSIPLFFKDKIYEEAKKAANEAVDAKVEIGNVNLSLIRSFPQIRVALQDVVITGTDEFDGQVLLDVKSISTAVNVSRLISGKGLSISSFIIDNPQVVLKINKDGKANWDIMKASEEVNEDTIPEEGGNMKIDLEKFEILEASLLFEDAVSKTKLSLENSSFYVSGDMHGKSTELDIKAIVKNITMTSKGASYAKGINVSLKSGINADLEKKAFSFLDNEIRINKLLIKAEGSFTLSDDKYGFDIKFSSPDLGLKELLGFIPENYQSYIKDFETDGEISFGGFVKGEYRENSLPAIGIDLNMKNGWLKHGELPGKVNNIEISANVSKPQGEIGLLVADIKKISAILAGNPLSAQLRIANPVTDPKFSGRVNGKMDFTSLANVFPMDSLDIAGIVDVKISFSGKQSDIEKLNYERIKTDGALLLRNFEFLSADFPHRVSIVSAKSTFLPTSISLSSLKGNIGKSDFAVSGSIKNYWPYILKKGTLNGNISFKSNLLDLNQIMAGSPGNTTEEEKNTQVSAFEVPDKINIAIQANVNRILYDRMVISNAVGKVSVRDRKLILDGLKMDMLKGEAVISGDYHAINPKSPKFNFMMDIKSFDIPSAFMSLATVRNFAPVAANSTGKFSTRMSLKGALGSDMSPVMESFNGGGNISSSNVVLKGDKVFDEISKYFSKGKFERVSISDFNAKYKIVNGGLEVSPFKTKIAGQDAVVSGRQSVNKNLDYKINFKVNKDDLNSDVNKFLTFVPGVGKLDKLPVGVAIKGTFDKPEVKVDMSEARKVVEQEIKKSSKKELENAAKKILDLFK